MSKLSKIIVFILLVVDFILILCILLSERNIQIFNPQGLVAFEQRNLIITYVLLMLIIVVPVFVAGYFIAWKYRASNAKADYKPDEKHSTFSEVMLWVFPTVIVVIMSIVTWEATHKLDAHKPLQSSVKPLAIQVIALQWKWLFIYPEQNIATVNYVVFPEKTPLVFTLTADGPMSSFWIPQLGGQLYAMTGMSQSLHLISDRTGEFRGSNAEINGPGFAGMKFVAKSVSDSEFELWVQSIEHTSKQLDIYEYERLAKPSEDTPVTYYSLTDKNLYNIIVMKYMSPVKTMNHE